MSAVDERAAAVEIPPATAPSGRAHGTGAPALTAVPALAVVPDLPPTAPVHPLAALLARSRAASQAASLVAVPDDESPTDVEPGEAAASGAGTGPGTGPAEEVDEADEAAARAHREELEELEFLLDSDPVECARRAAAGVEAAREAGDELVEMRLSYFLAFAHHLRGEDAAALQAAARTEEIAHEAGDLAWRSRALACRGLVHHDLGDVEDAVDVLRYAVELRREAQDPAGTAEVLNYLGSVYTTMAQFAPEAAQALEESRRLWLAAGDPDRASTALANLAANYVVTSARIAATNFRGGLAAARRALVVAQKAVNEADAAGLSRTAIDARLAVVNAHLVAGDLAKAETALAAASAMQARFPAPRQELALHRARSTLFVRLGRHDEAVAEVAAGLAMCDLLGRPAERIELLRTRVEAHEGAGDLGAALSTLHEVHDSMIELSETVAARRAKLLSSRLDLERAQRNVEAERRRAQALEARNTRLAYEASHDALTGLPNRRALDTALAEMFADEAYPFTVALVDIDHFKRVNDECSHQVGDRVLARLGEVLGSSLREGDLAARYGGEEFALVLRGSDASAAERVYERVRAKVAALRWSEPVPGGQVTVSIGGATRTASPDVADLLSRADAALYRAKGEGRNQVCMAG